MSLISSFLSIISRNSWNITRRQLVKIEGPIKRNPNRRRDNSQHRGIAPYDF